MSTLTNTCEEEDRSGGIYVDLYGVYVCLHGMCLAAMSRS